MIFLAFIWIRLEFTGLNISFDEGEYNSDSDNDIIADAKNWVCLNMRNLSIPPLLINRETSISKFEQKFCLKKSLIHAEFL